MYIPDEEDIFLTHSQGRFSAGNVDGVFELSRSVVKRKCLYL